MNQEKLPTGWELKKLGDVANFINGRAFKPSEWGKKGLPIIRIQNLNDSSKEFNYFEGEVESRYIVQNGDILISWSASLGAFIWSGEKAVLNQHIFKVEINENILDKRFLFYVVQTKIEEMKLRVHGSTMKHITKSQFDNVKIPLPPVSIQKKIAEILERADKLKQRRERVNEKTSNILQAIFMKMFGDPLKNENRFSLQTLKEVVANDRHSLKRGPFGGSLKKEIFVKEGYKVYEQQHAIKDNFDLGDYYITKDKYEEMLPFAVKEGDILVSCSGTIGKISIAPRNLRPGIINQALLKITVDRNKILQIYLKYFLESVTIQRKLFGSAEGSGIKNVAPMSIIKSTPIPVPPMVLQNKFVELVERVEKIRVRQDNSTREISILFDALMQRAFNGDL